MAITNIEFNHGSQIIEKHWKLYQKKENFMNYYPMSAEDLDVIMRKDVFATSSVDMEKGNFGCFSRLWIF